MDITILRGLLDYDYLSGQFTWKPGLRAVGGRRAGTVWQNGYIRIRVQGRYIYAHRLAFAFAHNRWPVEVDHVDGSRTNNALANLRECTRQQNQWNAARKGANPTSKFKGVHWNTQKKKWHARITVGRVAVHLGFFDDEDAAGAAYAKGAKHHAGEFARAA